MKPFLKLIRIEQWLKNGFLFLPLFFDQKLLDQSKFLTTCIGALAFCLAASVIYIFNDLNDIESDKYHPYKRNRPVASGAITKVKAWIYLFILSVGVVAICTFLPVTFSVYTGIYVAINVLYSKFLKHFAIIDVLILSTGYVLRVYAGGDLSHIQPSEWLVVMTFLLAMFLSLAKRRDDMALFISNENMSFRVIDGYNLPFLNHAITAMGTILILAYTMYILSPETHARFQNDYLFMTVGFVIAGVLRYLQITFVDVNAGSPSQNLIKDIFIKICVGAWGISLFVFIYLI